MIKKYPFLKTIARIIHEVKAAKPQVFIYFILYTLVGGTIPILAVYIPKIVITDLSNPLLQYSDLILKIGVIVLIVAFGGMLVEYARSVAHGHLIMVRINLLSNIFSKINTLDYKYMEDSKFLDANENAIRAVGGSSDGFESIMVKLFVLFSNFVSIIFYTIIILQLDVLVFLGVIVSVTVGLLTSIIVKKFQYKHKELLTHATRKLDYFTNMTHDFTYGKDIRLYQFQDRINEGYQGEIKSYLSVFKKIKNKELGLAVLDLLFVLVSDALLYYVLITRVLNGMSIADFTLYLGASLALTTLLKITSDDFAYIVGEGQYVNDYYQFMATEFNEHRGTLPGLHSPTFSIEFQDVSFKYPGAEKDVISHLNLTIHSGEKIAFVGVNGAGKTTLVKLMTRLFTPTEGKILINGVDINEFDQQEYFGMFSVVFQDINILAFTIRENITLQHSNDEERIWDCLERVGLKEKVLALPHGLDTMMLKVIDENGAIFSGGEQQKLLIARALYKNGRAIILDEPTASLDALAERDIYENFNDLVSEKTAIYISHRLASTKFCDHIALFSNGQLIEYGTHDELMQLKKEYYHMFVVQGKYYQEHSHEIN